MLERYIQIALVQQDNAKRAYYAARKNRRLGFKREAIGWQRAAAEDSALARLALFRVIEGVE